VGKANPIQTAMNGGELSPLMSGRVDVTKYFSGCKILENMIPLVQGPAANRSGTAYVAEVKDSSKRTALIEFLYSREVSYVVEVGDQYMRFYTNHGQILSGSSAYEISSPYLQADLFDADGILRLDYVQTGDVMYITHPSYPVQKLTRLTASTFSIAPVNLTGGPFQEINTDDTATVYANAQVGTVSLTASISIFSSGMEGSLFYLENKIDSGASSWQPNAFHTSGTRVLSDGKTYESSIPNAGSSKSIISVTNSNPISITTGVAHLMQNGDYVKIEGVGGMTEINDLYFEITAPTATTLRLNGINGTGFGTYTSGGTVRKYRKTGAVAPVHTSGTISDGNILWTYRDYQAGIVSITTVISGTKALAEVVDRLPEYAEGSGNPSSRWARALYSEANGYPDRCEFFRERLALAKSSDRLITFSKIGAFEDFSGTDFGEVTDESSFSMNIISSFVDDIKWLSSGDALLIGTTGAEFAIKETTTGSSFSITNSRIAQQSKFGSRAVKPLKINDATLFTSAAGTKYSEYRFSFDSEQYRRNILTWISDHITKTGIIDSAYQQEPDSIVWFIRADGVLISMTYDQIQDVQAWARHPITGQVESICVIPSPDGLSDELWAIVKRTINGQTERYVEYLKQRFGQDDDIEEAWVVDSGLSLVYQPTAITGITNANPAVVTSASHGLTNGQTVAIYDVIGMDGIMGNYTVANATTNTFELSGKNSTSLSAYVSGGLARRAVTTISGLDHLEGETVSILTNGGVHPQEVVTSGAITLDYPASAIIVGLPYVSTCETMNLEGGAEIGTAQGKTKRIYKCVVRFDRSVGLRFGPSSGPTEVLPFRSNTSLWDTAIQPFTGDKIFPWNGGYEIEGRLKFVQSDPLPFTIIAIMPRVETEQR